MKKQGVTLLLAIFISALALALGLGIFTIIFGELGISGTSKESLEAFYAADSGIECALFWDIKQQAFNNPVSGAVQCAGSAPSLNVTIGANSTTTSFSLLLSNSCARVTVQKIGSETIIMSLGENIACGLTGSRTVQRGLEVKY